MARKKEMSNIINKFHKKDPRIAVTLNPDQSAVTILQGRLSEPVAPRDRKKLLEHARNFVKSNRAIFGDFDEDRDLVSEEATTDRRGMTHVVFNQKHGSAQVLGGALSVHYNADGSIYLVKSNLSTPIDLPKTPQIAASKAVEIAQKDAGPGAVIFKGSEPRLVVADARTLHQEGRDQKHYLCWKMRIAIPEGRRGPDSIYIIDAIDGRVLLSYSAIQTGTGSGYYSQGAALNSEASGTTYRLRDTVTSSSWPVPAAEKPAISTYDDACSTGLALTNYSEDGNDNWNNGGAVPANRCDDQRAEVDLHRFLGYVLDYYYLTHGHNSMNKKGMEVKGHVHNMYDPGSTMPNNAFWDPDTQQLYFGDGNGTTRDFFTALDVVAHEFTHGVNTYFNIIQWYDGETGALNEAVADIFGCLISLDHPADDPWPWQHGRQYRLDGSLGRNLADPSRDAGGVVHYDPTSNSTKEASCYSGYYPDHYSIRYTGSKDYHGVHWNCPIITHAVYLMINGGTHRLSGVTVNGIGVAPVEEMLYHIISTKNLLTYTSVFADFRTAFLVACQTLYPENLDYLSAVKTAFFAVGIGPDLYIRDTLADAGVEPGTLSCMSPDIILRQQKADAATLALIGDANNASLCEQIKLGLAPSDHYVYFRIFNRGAASASGTFRLFISPSATFATPATWHEVGQFGIPPVSTGGMWVPPTADDCITLQASLISTLGAGHYCFIGIIESTSDPAPDRMMIHSLSEFHDFILMSNNYAWRNCDIIPLTPDLSGELPATTHHFVVNGLGPWQLAQRQIEIDTRDLPEGTQVTLWAPENRLIGLKAFEFQMPAMGMAVSKIADVLQTLPQSQINFAPVPLSRMAKAGMIEHKKLAFSEAGALKLKPMMLEPRKIVRLQGLALDREEKMEVQFTVKFPKNTGPRDVTISFRERGRDSALGQMNYVFRIREPERRPTAPGRLSILPKSRSKTAKRRPKRLKRPQ